MSRRKNTRTPTLEGAPENRVLLKPGDITLEDCLKSSISSFVGLGEEIETPGRSGKLIYIDNGSPVLGVGHLDFVKFNLFYKNMHGRVERCPQLDDRLGVFVILQQLYGIVDDKYDILLTDDEEIGASTAQYFKPKRQYNWMFEFDRRGCKDFVTYRYDNESFNDKLGRYLKNCSHSQGSFTDICYLTHLGCAGVNVSVGYYGAHTDACHAVLGECWRNTSDFAQFYQDHKDTKFEAMLNNRFSKSRAKTFVGGFGSGASNAGNPYSGIYIPESIRPDDGSREWTIEDLSAYGLLGAIDENDDIRYSDWIEDGIDAKPVGSRYCELCGEWTSQSKLCDDCQEDAVRCADDWFWSQSFKVKESYNEHSTWRH